MVEVLDAGKRKRRRNKVTRGNYTYNSKNGQTWHLNCQTNRINGTMIYYFSKEHRKSTSCDLPSDRAVKMGKNMAMPVVYKTDKTR
jgi:hypothetical protein